MMFRLLWAVRSHPTRPRTEKDMRPRCTNEKECKQVAVLIHGAELFLLLLRQQQDTPKLKKSSCLNTYATDSKMLG